MRSTTQILIFSFVCLALAVPVVGHAGTILISSKLSDEAVRTGLYRNFVWYRKAKLEIADFIVPELKEQSAVIFKYYPNDIARQYCGDVLDKLYRGELALATPVDNTYKVKAKFYEELVPKKYQELVKMKQGVVDGFIQYQDNPKYMKFIKEKVVPAIQEATEKAPRKNETDTLALGKELKAKIERTVVPSYQEFLEGEGLKSYESLSEYKKSLASMKVLEHDAPHSACIPSLTREAGGKKPDAGYSLIFLGVKPDLFDKLSTDQVVTWKAGPSVTGEASSATGWIPMNDVPPELLKGIGAKAFESWLMKM